MKLADQMKRLKENNYRVSVRLDSNDEIGVLYESFNEMSNRLDELINQVFEQKLRQEETELKALQAQINPHFLYNNLDTAYWMSRLEGADKTGRIVAGAVQSVPPEHPRRVAGDPGRDRAGAHPELYRHPGNPV